MMGWGGFCDRFGEDGMGDMGGLRGGGDMLGIVGPLLGLLFFLGLLALFVLGTIWLIRRTRTTSGVTAGGPDLSGSPLDLAKRRLAAGEITRDEYHQIREELREP